MSIGYKKDGSYAGKIFPSGENHWNWKGGVSYDMEKYHQERKEEISKYNKLYQKKNIEIIRLKRKEWYQKNKEKIKKYHLDNKDRINKNNRKRRREDYRLRLDDNISTAIGSALKGNKAGRKWESLVGYTLEKLIQRLSVNFQKGMTWDNYGEWHIDHKKPKSWFKYKTAEEQAFKDCWSLANLQPLWATDNFIKHNNYKN